MELAIRNSKEKLSVSDAVFGREFSEVRVHQVVVDYRNAGRAGTKAQKTRDRKSGAEGKRVKERGDVCARRFRNIYTTILFFFSYIFFLFFFLLFSFFFFFSSFFFFFFF